MIIIIIRALIMVIVFIVFVLMLFDDDCFEYDLRVIVGNWFVFFAGLNWGRLSKL